MLNKIKQQTPKIIEAINDSKNILLHCHPSPDPDSVGGALTIMHYLKNANKPVTVIAGDSEIPASIKLPGVEQILPKTYAQTDINGYDLFIILDSSNKGMISKEGDITFPKTLKTIVIDHHTTNEEYGDINLVDTDHPAVCQILYYLFKEAKISITSDMAICLFLGMYTDTGGFKYPKTTKLTFNAAAELAKINPSFPDVIFHLENTNEPERIKYIGIALNSVETYFNGRVAIAAVPYKALEENKIQEKHTEKTDIANTLKSVVGWDIGVSMDEVKPATTQLSFRTRDQNKYDVSKVAKALGGGGHAAAAGASIYKPLPEAKELLIEELESIYFS